MMKDPVCGMQVDENKAPATSTYQGQKYAFCGTECKEKFDKNPQAFIHGQHAQSGKQHEKMSR